MIRKHAEMQPRQLVRKIHLTQMLRELRRVLHLRHQRRYDHHRPAVPASGAAEVHRRYHCGRDLQHQQPFGKALYRLPKRQKGKNPDRGGAQPYPGEHAQHARQNRRQRQRQHSARLICPPLLHQMISDMPLPLIRAVPGILEQLPRRPGLAFVFPPGTRGKQSAVICAAVIVHHGIYPGGVLRQNALRRAYRLGKRRKIDKRHIMQRPRGISDVVRRAVVRTEKGRLGALDQRHSQRRRHEAQLRRGQLHELSRGAHHLFQQLLRDPVSALSRKERGEYPAERRTAVCEQHPVKAGKAAQLPHGGHAFALKEIEVFAQQTVQRHGGTAVSQGKTVAAAQRRPPAFQPGGAQGRRGEAPGMAGGKDNGDFFSDVYQVGSLRKGILCTYYF